MERQWGSDPHWRAKKLFAIAVAAALLLSACRADITVHVDVRRDGSGFVRVTATLDKEAADRIGPGGVVLADLGRAGWAISGNGSTVITATKPFHSPAQLASVVAELAGPTGPFKDFTVEQKHSLLRTTTRFHGTVEIRPCLADFADDDLRRALGGSAGAGQCLGLDPADVKRTAGVDPDQVVHFTMTARLPGRAEMRWPAPIGQRIALAAESRRTNTATVAWLAVAAVAVAALLALLLTRLAKRLMYTRPRNS